MFVTKRRCFDFLTHFCQYQVCLNARKLIYESFSANETSSAKSKKQVALTSDYICLQEIKRVLVQRKTSSNFGKILFVRLHLSTDKCDSCLPSLLLYFNIYFAPTDATMFQNIQQFQGDRIPIPFGF